MMDGIPERLDLSAEGAELLDLLLAEEGIEPRSEGIPRRGSEEDPPLSFSQERLWFLDRLQPGSALYNLPIALRLRGTLSVPSLEQSLNEIVRRHESLRTSFAEVDGQPVQRIHPFVPAALPVVDLSELPETEREPRALRLATEEARRTFDLVAGPLFRTLLLRLSPQDHLLVLAAHHIVSDGWSLDLTVQELGHLYESFLAGRDPALPELPIQFADYAHWQRLGLPADHWDAGLDYWSGYLSGAPALLDLPLDRPRPAVEGFKGALERRSLPDELAERVRRLSRQEGTTPFATLMAAFVALLYRYSGQEDLVVGYPIANRDRPELEGLIGFFVNTLVLRADLSADPTFLGLLGQVRDGLTEGYAHQDVPFEKLVERLRPERRLGLNPLFQVVFALQRGGETTRMGDVAVDTLELESGTSKFDLGLYIMDDGRSMAAEAEYNSTLFDANTVARTLEQFHLLLEGAVAEPETRVSLLPILTEAELRELRGGAPELTVPGGEPSLPIHRLFERQARLRPDAIAVTHDGRSWSYGELNARANRLAHYLVRQGVRQGEVVPVLLDRDLDTVATILGVLKAGAAYLPIEPSAAGDRLRFLLVDSDARLLLTRGSVLRRLDLGDLPEDLAVLLLDDMADRVDREEEGDLPLDLPLDALAYVIYTSGSTGRPKGVMVSHHNVVRLMSSTWHWFHFDENDVWTLFHSYAFDFSVWELWGPLLYGGRLVVVPYMVSRSPEAFYGLLRDERVTVLNQTPSAFRQLIRAEEEVDGDPDALSLRLVIFGGEALDFGSLRPWFDRHGDRHPELVNMYGITETTVHVTYRPVTAADLESAPGSMIGRPIPDLRLYVLDRHLQPVPRGARGELCVGGAGVALGYLNRPELTAQRFVADPFGAEPGARIYRSGDLARQLPNGDLQYLGRIDHQVKIRGFRIELGEIEAHLGEYPGMREVAVLVRDGGEDDQRLVAYLVAEGDRRPSEPELRERLAKLLPEYMIPSAFVFLDSMPLTANGKLDRRALPSPQRAESDSTFSAPRTALEEALAEIWSELLGVERVGIHDSFFDLGGHSLLAVRCLYRVRDSFQLDIPVRTLFESPTVAGLAGRIEELRREQQRPSPGPSALHPQRRGTPPLSLAQERLWFMDQIAPHSPLYNIPLAFSLVGPLDAALLERALKEVVRRHEPLRTTFVVVEGVPRQRIAPSVDVTLPVEDLRGLPEEEREAEATRRLDEEARRPFDLSTGPLLRCGLLRLGSRDRILWLVAHHIIFDGRSTEILVQELSALYQAFADGQASPLQELQIQYADYAAWQRGRLSSGEVLEAQLSYWREQMAGAPHALEIPTDHPRPVVLSYRGATETILLSRELSEALQKLSRQEAATIFMTLLAAFDVLLHRYTGQDDLVVGSPVANRGRAELDELIGFFVNTLALRTDLSGDPTFRELLGQRVWKTTLGAYAYEEMPLERLVDELRVERDQSRHPLFQVAFVPEISPAAGLTLPEVECEPIALTTDTAKLDLTLAVAVTPEGLRVQGEYSTDLFESGTVERMLEHYRVLLEGIVADPDAPISRLPLLTEAEERQLLEWRGEERVYPEGTIHGLFEGQVERTPEGQALVVGGEVLSYLEVERRANGVAGRLRGLGVGPEGLVGVCLGRGVGMVVALLGVLKAGGAYVPLDPGYPEERLSYMLEDSGARVVVSERALEGRFVGSGVEVVCVEDIGEGERPSGLVGPDNLAYVIYTSGSTGRPKGVAVAHRAVAPRMLAASEMDALGPGDRVLQFVSPSFDVFVAELFATLISGAALVIHPNPAGLSPAELLRWCGERGVTLIRAPWAFWQQAADQLSRAGGRLPAILRTVISGGEQPDAAGVARLAGLADRPVLFANEYGPTEAVVVATRYELGLDSTEADASAGIPIGRPLPNTRVYLLDDQMRPVPIGVPGEIWLGGPSVARGYVGDPQLTAERFRPDPFAASSGRIYRTGDLARYRSDGRLEFLGRTDDQVKLRGFRIELGEVEAALRIHPDVREAVASIREDRPGDRALVAYVVADDGVAENPAELRTFLRGMLPDYMVPSAVVPLEALPLTPSGKLDRKSLPAPSRAHRRGWAAYEPPRTEMERTLADMWGQLLGLERVGVHDNFFDLGGHSLLATQLASRLRDSFRVELPLRALFDAPTISGLSRVLERARDESLAQRGPELVPLARSARRRRGPSAER